MIEEIKSIKSGKKELREFGIIMGIALGVIGGALLLRHKENYSYFFVFSAGLFLLSFTAPAILKPVQKIWMTLAVIIGWLMTRVILLVLFYFVVTPIGIIARVTGNKLLDIKFEPAAQSYWISKDSGIEGKSMENQF